MPFVRRLWPLSLSLVVAFALAAGPRANAARADTRAAVEKNVVGFLETQLREYAGTEGPFVDGVWTSPENACWACNNGGPATAAAALYVVTGSTKPEYRSDSIETIEAAIATGQNANGSFTGPPTNHMSPGMTTEFFGVEFGTVYHLLAATLSPAQRTRWQRALAEAASFLITDGDTKWYANGNVNLGYTEFLYLVWQATGEVRFKKAYEESWEFTLHPPQNKFPGCGWVTVTPPNSEDGAGGTGYLAETGEGGTGFDAEYAQFQLDEASRLYLLSHDPRALRLSNMLMNILTPRINKVSWMLDTSGGSRHLQQGRQVGFMASAFAVLGLSGLRPELAQYTLPQIEKEESWYPQPFQADSGGFRRAFGGDVATIALAAAPPPGLPVEVQADGGVALPIDATPLSLKQALTSKPRNVAAKHRRRAPSRRRRGARASRVRSHPRHSKHSKHKAR